MHFSLDKNHKDTLYEQTFIQLISALHIGKLAPGDRLPSVRQIAQRNNINLKTAFAIYQRLQCEGYITLRTGSGAYVSQIDQSDLDQTYCISLLRLIKTNLSEAERLKISASEYVQLLQSFLNKPRPASVKMGVIECNEEQIEVFAAEISNRLGITVYPLLLDELEAPNRSTDNLLEKTDFLATTDFHFNEVKSLTKRYQKRILQLRLNSNFVPAIVEAAKRGTVLMIVSNEGYFPAFRKSLLHVGTPPPLVERIRPVEHVNMSEVKKLAATSDTIYVSPICDPHVRKLLPAQFNELKLEGTLSMESIEAIESFVLFQSLRQSI